MLVLRNMRLLWRVRPFQFFKSSCDRVWNTFKDILNLLRFNITCPKKNEGRKMWLKQLIDFYSTYNTGCNNQTCFLLNRPKCQIYASISFQKHLYRGYTDRIKLLAIPSSINGQGMIHFNRLPKSKFNYCYYYNVNNDHWNEWLVVKWY